MSASNLMEDYIGTKEAVGSMPAGRNGRPIHPATLVRWITIGTKGPTGDVIKLKGTRMGGRWLTKREWIEDYSRRLTSDFSDR